MHNIREVRAYDTITFGPLFQDVNNGGKNYGSLKPQMQPGLANRPRLTTHCEMRQS
jgi:hypothetical protein